MEGERRYPFYNSFTYLIICYCNTKFPIRAPILITESPCYGLGRQYSAAAIAEWDVGELHAENRRRIAKSAGAAIGFMPDDSTGAKEIFRDANLYYPNHIWS